jgi:hypothetical protein
VCKGSSKLIIRDVILEKGVLHIKLNTAIYVDSVKDFDEEIVSHDLIVHSI